MMGMSNAVILVKEHFMVLEEQQAWPWETRHWRFGNLELAAGSKAAGLVEHGSFADGTPLQTPLHVIIGPQEGPTLYVQAAVHGDEVNGIEVLRRVVTSITPEQLRGILLVVPVTNGPGMVQRQRRNPFDEEDMNRVWPGKQNGMASQQIAYSLYQQVIRHAHYVIDLHTANSNTLLHVVYGRGDEVSRKLAEVFALDILLEEEVNSELQQARFTGKLRNTLTAHGIPAITPELGGNNYFEEAHIALGVRGVMNVLKHLGMLAGEIVPPDRPQVTLAGSHLNRVYARYGGIWIAEVKGGDLVKQGDLLGSTYSLRTFEVVEQVFAPYDGFILGTTDLPMVNMGDGLVNLCPVRI
jgi:predicted deacylase